MTIETVATPDPAGAKTPALTPMNSLPQGKIYEGSPADAKNPDHSVMQLSGPPAATELPDSDPDTPTPATQDPAIADHVPEIEPAEKDVAIVPDADPADAKAPAPPRHKTLEAAEKSYAHAQAKLTVLAQENADLKRDKSDREAAHDKAESESAREKFYTDRFDQAGKDIAELDEYAPDFTAQSAKVWAECHKDIAAFVPDTPGVPGTLAPTPAAVAPPENPAGEISPTPGPEAIAAQELPPAGAAPAEAAETPEEARTKITARLTNKGVEPAEFTIEDPVFYNFAAKAPNVSDDGQTPLSFDEQVDWAIAETRNHYTQKRSEILQGSAQPLGRAGVVVTGGKGPSAIVPKQTLNGAVASALNRRVLS